MSESSILEIKAPGQPPVIVNGRMGEIIRQLLEPRAYELIADTEQKIGIAIDCAGRSVQFKVTIHLNN